MSIEKLMGRIGYYKPTPTKEEQVLIFLKGTLTDREYKAVVGRIFKGFKFNELATKMKILNDMKYSSNAGKPISCERTRQIYNKALRKLRDPHRLLTIERIKANATTQTLGRLEDKIMELERSLIEMKKAFRAQHRGACETKNDSDI